MPTTSNTFPPALRWAFRIDPNYSWFRDFATSLGGEDVTILIDEEDDRPPAYAWSSSHLTELQGVQEVCDRAAALKALFDGAMFIYTSRYHSLPLEQLYEVESGHPHSMVTGNALVSPFSPAATTWRYRPQSAPFNHPVSKWLFLARYSDVAKGILLYLGFNGMTWTSLYAAFDFLKTNGADIPKLAGVGKKQVELLKHTANNFATIGPLARHGDLGHQPPASPMGIDEARKIVRDAVRGYFEQLMVETKLKNVWESAVM